MSQMSWGCPPLRNPRGCPRAPQAVAGAPPPLPTDASRGGGDAFSSPWEAAAHMPQMMRMARSADGQPTRNRRRSRRSACAVPCIAPSATRRAVWRRPWRNAEWPPPSPMGVPTGRRQCCSRHLLPPPLRDARIPQRGAAWPPSPSPTRAPAGQLQCCSRRPLPSSSRADWTPPSSTGVPAGRRQRCSRRSPSCLKAERKAERTICRSAEPSRLVSHKCRHRKPPPLA